MQRLMNIGLIGLLGKSAKEMKKSDDNKGKAWVKIGLILVGVTEVLLLVSDFMDIRKRKIEEQLENISE